MAAQWVRDHVDPDEGTSPPQGKDVRRKLLRQAPKSIADCYHQLLSGHAAIGPYLRDKIHKTDDDRC